MKASRITSRPRRLRPVKTLKIWLYQHAQAFVFSLGQFFKNPFSNFLSTVVIGISLALPATFYLMLNNAQQVIDNWEGTIRVTLFLKQGVSDADARTLAETLRHEDGVAAVRYISRDEALQEYKRQSGLDEVLDSLEENPLPASLIVTPGLETLSSGQGEALLKRLNNLDQVDSARYDNHWIQRLLGILHILQRGVVILSCLLAVAILLIVGNTIRLSINNRHTEIEINKLFGATDAFVQRPFLYSGLIHGVIGGLIAWLLVSAALLLLDQPIAHLATLYQSDFTLHGLGAREVLWLTAGAGSLGVAGSWLAVQRHLRQIETG